MKPFEESLGSSPTLVGGQGKADTATLVEGAVLGNYRIIRLLGAGGMGAVYLVEHVEQKTRHALKTIRPEFAKQQNFAERFQREAKLATRLKHPHIVTCTEAGVADGIPYLVMDYIEGPAGEPLNLCQLLEQRRERGELLDEDEATAVGLEICKALDYAHSYRDAEIPNGIIHRDLKPANILLDKDTKLYIADFGLARMLGEKYEASVVQNHALSQSLGEQATLARQVSVSADTVGTFDYMSPEQREGRVADARSDVYAMGVILYELLTGRKVVGVPELPSAARPGLRPVWDEIIFSRCLAYDPNKRFATAGELARAIEAVPFQTSGKPATSGSPSTALGVGKPRKPAAVKSLMLVAALAGVGLAMWWFNGGPTSQTAASATNAVQVATHVPPTNPVVNQPTGTPVTAVTPATKTSGAAVTLSCSEAVRVDPLEVGRPTAYDSENRLQLHRLEFVSPELASWQFLYSPLHKVITYEIRVNQDGFLYALGSGNKSRTSLSSEENSKWEDAAGRIRGSAARLCIRRKVVAGEVIKLQATDLRLAAKSIELISHEKPDATTQPAAPIPSSATTTPVAVSAPVSKVVCATIAVSCSEAARILPLEIGQPTVYDLPQHKLQVVSPDLSGCQLLAVPLSKVISYEIRVKQDGVLYVIGSGRKTLHSLGDEENARWEDATGVISGAAVNLCLRRRVVGGEVIKLQGTDLRFVAKSIELVSDGKPDATTQPASPVSAISNRAPVAVSIPAKSAAITVLSSAAVRVLPLMTGQPRMYNSTPAKPIKTVSSELTGWQFLSIPFHTVNAYEIHVNQDGTLYAFGGGTAHRTYQEFLGTKDVTGWEEDGGAIGSTGNLHLRRKVKAGEIIKISGMELALAAKSIYLSSPEFSSNLTTPGSGIHPQPSATSRACWTNSLGMVFVPVPGTAVKFSIWDTRVQDYQAFVTATGRAWGKPPFEQGTTHPAVMVSWDDAKAFCAWLTEKERRAGTLAATQLYRLPTDLEWSVAVGLENEPGATPQERDGKVRGVYPWGTQWPPPQNAGNFFVKKTQFGKVDDFYNTSPVDAFSANRFGLYDMGGNVWQWCEDFYDGQDGARVLRGGAWKSLGGVGNEPDLFLSSRRTHSPPMKGSSYRGFRCVLAESGVSASQTPSGIASTAGNSPAPTAAVVARVPAAQAGQAGPIASSTVVEHKAGDTMTVELGGGVRMELVWIPHGKFLMGSPADESSRSSDEGPQHQVTISSGFWMGKTEVTQRQYEQLACDNPSNFKEAELPVERVDWNQAKAFCAGLQARLPAELHSKTARLPTEAEWEYACRAGSTGPYAGALDRMGWYDQNSGNTTHPAGQKQPNAWGLHDMHGNVWEWCWDGKREYLPLTITDPKGGGALRVFRGGSCDLKASFCRSAERRGVGPGYRSNRLGFRIVVR